MLDFYLSDEGKVHLPDINRLAKVDTPEADDCLLHYCMEGIRLNGTFGSYREAAAAVTIDDGGRSVSVTPGDKVFCSFVRLSISQNLTPLAGGVLIHEPRLALLVILKSSHRLTVFASTGLWSLISTTVRGRTPASDGMRAVWR